MYVLAFHNVSCLFFSSFGAGQFGMIYDNFGAWLKIGEGNMAVVPDKHGLASMEP